ncbi:MAG: gliding motility protein GldN [bacterium]|nr:gliding motility protein GldN [bacterium]
MFKLYIEKIVLCICCFGLFGTSNIAAQVNYSEFITSGEPDSYYKRKIRENTPVAIPMKLEVDVKLSKRIIRCIDTRQKMNKQLEWPRLPLSRVLYEGLTSGGIRAYRSDSFASVYNSIVFSLRGSIQVPVFISTDPTDASIGIDTFVTEIFNSDDIHKFWIMEDWIFDYKHSVFKPVIIGIAPVFKQKFSTFAGREAPLCWIKMEEIRPMLMRIEMFNRYNDAARLNYDDFFQMRIFDSYIVFQSNVYDSYVNQLTENENNGVNALLASDEIKNDLFIFEHDLWQY